MMTSNKNLIRTNIIMITIRIN